MENIVPSNYCKLCKKTFSRKSSLNRHVKEQHIEPGLYQCKQCGLRLSKKYNLEVHTRRIHPKIPCNFKSGREDNLIKLKRNVKHVRNYQKPEVCTNSALASIGEPDAKTLAETVLKELKQLQQQIQKTEQVISTEAYNEQDITATKEVVENDTIIKDSLYPLGHFTLVKTQTIKRQDGVKYFICEFCHKEFRKTYNYLRHLRIHTKVRPFVCILCKKSFPTTAQLKTHCVTHKLHERFGIFRKLYNCPKCNEGFGAIKLLDKHLCSPNSCNVSFKCQDCGKSHRTLKTLLRHKHMKKDNEVEILKSILPTPLILEEESKLSEDKDNNFECNFCGILMDKRILLKQHKRRHENLYWNQCAQCQCPFVTQTALKVHTKVHLTIRKFKCHYCNKCFQTDQSCRRHMLNHIKVLLNTEKTSQKENDSLILYPTFIEHTKKCQIETAPTPIIKSSYKKEKSFQSNTLKYKCTECEKSFLYKAWLRKHFIYKHTADLLYECVICLKNFRTKQTLQNHLVVHSTTRVKLTCQVCGRQYASSKSLKVHLRIHTQETPFKCDKCCRKFRTSGHLIQHRKSSHTK